MKKNNLLVIDIGNTNIVMGIYTGNALVSSWRIRTERNMTEDEFAVLAKNMFMDGPVSMDEIGRTVISCVVPPMVSLLDAFCRKYLAGPPEWVDSRSCGIMPIRVRNPGEVGADRIVNAVAAYEKYRRPLVVIDFGTATTFDVISGKGEYLGGAISPGIMVALEALVMKASKLPRVEIFTPPENVVGKDTIESIQSGLIYGYAGLVDGMVSRMEISLAGQGEKPPKIVATGGLAPLMARVSEKIEVIEPDLTLEGLRIISTHMAGK